MPIMVMPSTNSDGAAPPGGRAQAGTWGWHGAVRPPLAEAICLELRPHSAYCHQHRAGAACAMTSTAARASIRIPPPAFVVIVGAGPAAFVDFAQGCRSGRRIGSTDPGMRPGRPKSRMRRRANSVRGEAMFLKNRRTALKLL